VILTNGDLDHCLGLLALRESQPLELYATAAVLEGLRQRNVLFRTLERFAGHTSVRPLVMDRWTDLDESLSMLAFAVAGKLPLHLEDLQPPSSDDNIGLVIRDRGNGARLAYVPNAASVTDLAARIEGVDALILDGTFYTSDELQRLDAGARRAEDMAHLPIGGPTGSLRALAGLTVGRRIYSHVNNTNPILDPTSLEAREVAAAGWVVADDGMELSL
jgi:pyrroloquinoline quinone biosynthesis protein B